MNAEQRHIYERTAELKVTEAVHYPGCELVHGWCAVQALLSAHELADIENLIYSSFYEGVEKVMWQDAPDAILLDRVQALVQTIIQYRNTQEHPDISASTTSGTLPESECNSDFHDAPTEVMNRIEIFFCAKCGEKL
jgi:hypothetical protein